MSGFLLRRVRNLQLKKICVPLCSSSSEAANAKSAPSERKKPVGEVNSQAKKERIGREPAPAAAAGWVDVNRSYRPGQFRSRNVAFERFFSAQQRQQRFTAREQWSKRTAGSGRPATGAGTWSDDFELPKFDYKNLNLPPIQKNFYKEHATVASRTEEEISQWLKRNEVTMDGGAVPRPIFSFDEAGFPDDILQKLKLSGFQKPTEIQSVSWPVALSGQDMISIARTGSGKTLAYILPGLIHMQGQQQLKNVHGPAVLVLAPTRELVQQISMMTSKFHGKVSAAFGGAGRDQQARIIQGGIDVLAAAPGRLLDFLVSGVFNLHRCTYLVLDEADRMLDMGFEPQIRKILSMIRPDRQTLMFSATWPKEVRNLAKDFLTDPVFVNVGSLKLAANHNIVQIVEVVEESQKEEKLLDFLTKVSSEPNCKTLVFVGMKRTADWLTRLLRREGYSSLSIHGDKSQTERNFVMNDFKNGECSVLVATDVAARGLDVSDIKFVINYDCPKNAEDYIHRIGRTARHDKKGTSYTLCTVDDVPVAGDLIGVLKEANQTVPEDLQELAHGRLLQKQARGFVPF